MFAKFLTLTVVALASISTVEAYNITYHSGKGCRGQHYGSVSFMGPDQGCQRGPGGNYASIRVTSTGPADDPMFVVFYSSDDCNPSNEVQHGDEGDSNGKCYDVNAPSLSVWNMYNLN
jgi:hypothetical protein